MISNKIESTPEAAVKTWLGQTHLSESADWERESDNHRPANSHQFSKCRAWVEGDNFYRPKENKSAFLVIGFDTEFQTPSEAVSRADIAAGRAKYEVLSYQAHCKLYDPEQPDAPEWGGICFPDDRRLTLAEFLIFALSQGLRSGAISKIPTIIYLTGHFTRADMRAFDDFERLTHSISAVRNTFVSVDDSISIAFQFEDGAVELDIRVRDTGLLAATSSKSLAAIGEVVGVEKVSLSTDPAEELQLKRNMSELLRTDPALFEHYAYTDAVICVRYLDEILRLCESIVGEPEHPPLTLSAIGVDVLGRVWDELGRKSPDILGFEMKSVRRWDKRLGKFISQRERIAHERFHWHEPVAVEAYHGGRGEQFWFGPGWVDEWLDYDLSSAYPTAMSLIRMPNWDETFVTTRLDDFTYETMGVAKVKFKFPDSVRYPTLPVRTEHGLIFPLEGESNCAAPEIALARALGADLTIEHGVIVPPLEETFVFEPYVKLCIAKREEHPKGSLRNLAWKELTNATYGKLAQGLRQKRVYDLKERNTKPLLPSKVTNAFFAAFTTSFVRATLGEIMNRLPAEVTVFSCTTDGFLSNATEGAIATATAGPVCQLYSERRFALTGKRSAVEVKHRIRQPLGWRTRGQATLTPGDGPPDDESNIVLAKGGIWTPGHMEELGERNDYICGLFLERDSDTVIEMTMLTGVRDMVERGADLVEKLQTRRLNMEFDWKRRPLAVGVDPGTGHLCFSTEPWRSVGEFNLVRDYWDEWSRREKVCLKGLADYEGFAAYADAKSGLSKNDRRYLSSKAPDIRRLRQCLGVAWRTSNAGLDCQQDAMSAAQFAAVLTDAGIPCKRSDIENDAKKIKRELERNPRLPVFQPGRCPRTPAVMAALSKLLETFPDLDVEAIVAPASAGLRLLSALSSDDMPEAE